MCVRMRTEGNGGSPAKNFSYDRFDIWQGWTVCKGWYARRANYRVELGLCSCLDLRIKNHHEEEY